ncbi:MAG: hypothetical protein CYG60_06630 [Actinobacteria bacterium]|nr:hypothetical protein [Actinomycetota bacterium]PLS86541.1 MAG: hypothetical protein CYG60_06630 [Actinomycetota bacterium]
MAEGNRDKDPKNSSSQFIAELLSEYLKADEKTHRSAGDPKNSSAEAVTELLSRYLTDEEFRVARERVQQAAGERIRNIRNRYRARKRAPETAMRERDLSLRLAEVEAEAAELRLRLAELLEEEGRLRSDLEEL